MIALSHPHNKKLIILVGRGFVGSAILKELKSLKYVRLFEFDPAWFNKEVLIFQTENLLLHCNLATVENVAIIWSAGKAGFNASNDEVINEFDNFRVIVDLFTQQFSDTRNYSLEYHLISSGGGLFEGIRNITSKTIPRPLRPYGHMKYKQEQYLTSRDDVTFIYIYRTSTLYGFIEKGQRYGLISVLISNLINHNTTPIFGSYSTMRDYLWVNDAARFIANKVASNSIYRERVETFFLAAGQPITIFEIQKLIEKISNKRCFISFTEKMNEQHITFSSKCLPNDFRVHSLRFMIKRIYKAALNSGTF
jgi:nucleoside-diphosphate-sugar epimerase